MTNEMIILSERIKLMGDGILKPTGRRITLMTDDGEIEVDEPEPIFTMKELAKRGLSVKGQHAVASIEIWIKRNDGNGQDNRESSKDDTLCDVTDKPEFIKKKAYFFTLSQAHKMERKVTDHDKIN